MSNAPIDRESPVDDLIRADQKQHWAATFAANPYMYGTEPSEPALAAAELFTDADIDTLVELGAGQGRDTPYFARRGLRVTALDFAPEALASIFDNAKTADLADRMTVIRHDMHHDMRQALPLPDASFDACYSHMLSLHGAHDGGARAALRRGSPRGGTGRVRRPNRAHHGRRPLRHAHRVRRRHVRTRRVRRPLLRS